MSARTRSAPAPTGVPAWTSTAREDGIPYPGTGGGFQHTLPEYARDVCGLTRFTPAENDPDAEGFLFEPPACPLVATRPR